MVVNDLDIVRIAFPERKTERQRAFTIIAHCPARSPLSL
jgi:hypothetical protein